MCMSKPKPPKVVNSPSPLPPSPETIDPAVMQERERERIRQRGKRGRQSTMLASRASDYLPPTGQQKMALGV